MKRIISFVIVFSMLCAYIPTIALEDGGLSWDVRKNKYRDYGLEMPLRPADKAMCGFKLTSIERGV